MSIEIRDLWDTITDIRVDDVVHTYMKCISLSLVNILVFGASPRRTDVGDGASTIRIRDGDNGQVPQRLPDPQRFLRSSGMEHMVLLYYSALD